MGASGSINDDLVLMVPIDRFEQTVRFYDEGLNLKLVSRDHSLAVFTLDKRRLVLSSVAGDLSVADTGLRFQVNGLTECLKFLADDGFIPPTIPGDDGESNSEIQVKDPAGNIMTFVEADRSTSQNPLQ